MPNGTLHPIGQSRISSTFERALCQTYDEKLGWIHNWSVPGCAAWIFRDHAFTAWLDVSTRAAAWFWLQGIPGAGKNYVSVAMVERARETQHGMLFVFVSEISRV